MQESEPGRLFTRRRDKLVITIDEVMSDSSHELGIDPGLQKDGVEAHLQALLAEHIHTLGDGWTLLRREYGTAIGPCRHPAPVTQPYSTVAD